MSKKQYTGVQITTPLCRLAFPALFEKRPKFQQVDAANGEYSVCMVFDRDTDLGKLKGAIIQAAKNEFGADVDLASLDLKRIRDGNTMGREEFKNKWVIRAKTSKTKPGVVDAKLQKILDPSEIYGGVYAHVAVTAKAYTMPKKGVTFYLNHVQKVKDGEAFSMQAPAEDVFDSLDLNVGTTGADVTSDPALDATFS